MVENFDHIDKLYRLLSEEEWSKFQDNKLYHGSAFDRATGFLHFSMAEQVKTIAGKFFGATGHVILLEIKREKLDASKLIFEKNTPTGDTYPHYYGALDFDDTAVIYKGVVSKIKLPQ